MNMERKPAIRGFTLIELMVAVAILAFMMVVGVPAFKTFVQNNRQTSQLNEVVMTMLTARSEAVRSNTPVVICTSSDGKTCCGTAAGCDKWEMGWIVFTDVVRETAAEEGQLDDQGSGDELTLCEDADDDCLLSLAGELPAGTTLRFNGGANAVTYLPQGGTDVNGMFTLCVPDASRYREVTVTSTGRPMTSYSPPGGGKATVESCP